MKNLRHEDHIFQRLPWYFLETVLPLAEEKHFFGELIKKWKIYVNRNKDDLVQKLRESFSSIVLMLAEEEHFIKERI